MQDKQIEKMGSTVFSRVVTPLRQQGLLKSAMSGSIDMEYYSGGLLSLQISIQGQARIYYLNYLDIGMLREIITKQMKAQGINYEDTNNPIHLFLATYWSSAEFQHINNLWEESEMRHVTQKIMNSSFIGHSVPHTTKKGKVKNKTTLKITMLDIYHFFTDLKIPVKSLDKVAELYELRAQKGSFEGVDGMSDLYWKQNMDKALKLHPRLFRQYALQDVIVTEELMEKHRRIMFNETGIDIFRAHTNGGLALSYFRTTIMEKGDSFGDRNQKARHFSLRCAHGAVMVALKEGLQKSIYENDFKQFYTYTSMNTKLLPRSAEDIKLAGSLTEVLSGYDGWCKCRFEFPAMWNGKKVFPTLPVQEYYPNSQKLSPILFPYSGISWCTVSEIRVAQLFGAKIEFIAGYYYTSGTDKWSKFATEQVALRKEAEAEGNKIEAGIHKSMPNAGVGKLLQHNRGYNIDSAKAEADFLGVELIDVIRGEAKINNLQHAKDWHKTPEELELLNKIIPGHREEGTGTAFLPEWWSIILGRARAALWWTVNIHGVEPVHLSTDSYHDVKPLNKTLETPVGKYVIEVKSVNAGEDMLIARTKLNIHGNKVIHEPDKASTKEYKEAVISHAVHTDRKSVGGMILDGKVTKYTKTGTKTLLEAIKTGGQFAEQYEREMQFNPGFDNKVKKVGESKYEPWQDIGEYFEFMEKIKR